MGTKLVAIELLITIEQKAEPCKLHRKGARRCFLPGSREFPIFAKTKKSEIEKYWSYNKVMRTKLLALELLITFEQKAEPCKLQGSGARRCFLIGSREFPTFCKDQKNRN